MIKIRLEINYDLLSEVHGFRQKEWRLFETLIKQLTSCEVKEVLCSQGIEISVENNSTKSGEALKDDVIQAGQQALERVVKWHKKSDLISGISLLAVYVLGVMFFSAAYSQTHGVVSLVILAAAFGLLFVPWWFSHLRAFIEDNLIGEP